VTEREDAYGRLVLDHLEGRPAVEVIERDDGFIGTSSGPAGYFAPVRRWFPCERRALRLARGRVLDVGCGAGRVALELQRRGHEVVGIDVSPLALEVARRRGMKDARLLPFQRIDASLGRIDTVVMFGNNFGLFGGPKRARTLLRRLLTLTSDRARILGASVDVYATDDHDHLAYHELNRSRGRMAGELRLRVRHGLYASPWFDYLIVSRDEMRALAESAGWRLARTIDEPERPFYVGVLEKA
jgi:SAM-dependent methyltransferase